MGFPRSVLNLLSVAVLACTSATWTAQAADNGCRNGAVAVANAYVADMPFYAVFFGFRLERYVAQNASLFMPGADAIRCASALSVAFLRSAVQLYDPQDAQRQEKLRIELESRGISPGPRQASASDQSYARAMKLARLARVLPPAAQGDFEPLRTPVNELEELERFGAQLFEVLLQDPMMRSAMAAQMPLMQELMELDHKMILQAAAFVARQP